MGDSVPAKVEEGLERSRILLLVMSAHAFGSDWAHLAAGVFPFKDALNKERRFVPMRLDDAETKGSLAQFLYVDWRAGAREGEYRRLLNACAPAERVKVKMARSDHDDWRILPSFEFRCRLPTSRVAADMVLGCPVPSFRVSPEFPSFAICQDGR